MTFNSWKSAVNTVVRAVTGSDCDDLKDWPYRKAFDAGQSPRLAAFDAIIADGRYS